ncbi:hypothetical protein KKF34_19580 [Myxococcota bacterium]|nr:hypothetical protein [Myxococcota bacterium]MBU1380225.1 hypothetical protein [Myxococcota bacterium]MBU1499091.1 hypothetical protein [Myxococcota bacterium]
MRVSSMDRREQLIRFLKEEAGLSKYLKTFILSIVGLVLIGAVLGILVSVKISGATGSDDIMVPLVIVALLLPPLVWSIYISKKRLNDIKYGEINDALIADPPAVSAISSIKTIWGIRVDVTLVSGRKLHFFMDQETADEVVVWLGEAIES